jgi:hypothetical protein
MKLPTNINAAKISNAVPAILNRIVVGVDRTFDLAVAIVGSLLQ